MDSRKIGSHATQVESPESVLAFLSIVGIGASAGGLEAFSQLLKHLPTDTGMAFVLVQHLDPAHESELARLLAKTTIMPTCEVTNDLRVVPNHVYVIPPNVSMSIERGALKLLTREAGRAPHRSIDFFFESLARDQRERAIGVVLSGTATDGTLGLEAIKAEGGITFAQDESAKQDSMPRSAIGAGCVDFVLSPEKIAAELARIAKHPYVVNRVSASVASDTADENGASIADKTGQNEWNSATEVGFADPSLTAGRMETDRIRGVPAIEDQGLLIPDQNGFKKALAILRTHCGVDFSLYKTNTIQRRVTRRMILNKQETLDGYATFLKGNQQELDALYSDVLISVTSFFRNPEAFEALKLTVFPRLLEQRTDDDPLRVWVLGCSTGQEAYSIAMSFAEFSDGIPRAPKLMVFATDLNEAVLNKARQGLYAKTLAEDVSPERLQRFFVEETGGYRVSKALREQIVFARQNLIGDPPFSRMDLISCRNLMIYLEPALQRKLIPTFHYSLKSNGFLFLGASESIGQFTDMFEPADKKQKIFVRKAAPAPTVHLPASNERATYQSPGQRPASLSGSTQEDGLRIELNAQREADRVSVSQFAPPGVLINSELQILQFRGPTSPYLEPPQGKASFDVLKMARDGLRLPLRAAINEAKQDDRTVRIENIRLDQDDATLAVTLHVIPLKNLKERCFLILFEHAGAKRTRRRPATAAASRPRSRSDESLRIAQLERELAETRGILQSVQEQAEAANDEMQASNEEAQSSNEELQSINEELETSKEELESTNEELTTVNDEMGNRNQELNRLNGDLNNLQVNIHTAILLLDRDQTIRRFTAPAQKLFNLVPADIGRPLSGIKHNLIDTRAGGMRAVSGFPTISRESETLGEVNNLQSAFPIEVLVRDVIETVSAKDCDVRDKDGRWYSLRIRPYLTLDHQVDGAVLMLVDIDALKRSEQNSKAAKEYTDAILRTVHSPLIVLDGRLRVKAANESFYRTFKTRADLTEWHPIYEINNGQWNIPKLRLLLEDILPQNRFFNDFEVTLDVPDMGPRTLLLNARQVKSDGTQPLILLAIDDVTERLQSRVAVKASELRYRRLFEAAKDGILMLDAVSRKITDANPFISEFLGYSRDELLEKELWEIGLLKDEQASHAAFRELQEKGFIRYEDLPLQTKNGQKREVEFVSNLYRENGHDVIQCNIRDITERKQVADRLRESEERYRTLFELGPVAVYSCDASGVIREYNSRAVELWGRRPKPGDTDEKFCGSFKLYRSDGSFMPYEQCPMAQVLAGKIPGTNDAEVQIERSNFSRITVIVNIRPLKNDRDQIIGAINCFYDVTERKHVQEALRDSEERLRLALTSADMGSWRADLSTGLTTRDANLNQILGYAAVESTQPIGDYFRLIHRDDKAEIIAAWQLTIEKQDAYSAEFRLLRDDGTTRWLREQGRFIAGKSDFPDFITGVTLDITERKLADEMLQENDRRKNEFLAMLAHELRNPLAPIRNAAQVLRLAGADEQMVRSASEMMERQIGQMVRLVDDLLDVSRISRGKIELRKGRIELASAVNHAIEAARPLCETMHHELTISLPKQPIYLKADPTRLAQVVGNLLNNACKFTDKGGHLWLTVTREGEQAVIRIRDSGIGIAADQIPRIFEMFMQVDTSIERSVSGLGIGLMLVKTLVELHGGTIGVQSGGIGQGTEFMVRLPILVETPMLPPPVPTAVALRPATVYRILVVDDNRDSAESLSLLLEMTGNETHMAYDGLEALQAAESFKPEVVLLDIGLPKLNGYEVARKIREQPWGKAMVLVALTGWGQEEDLKKSSEAGFNGHMVKPVELASLQELLARVVPITKPTA